MKHSCIRNPKLRLQKLSRLSLSSYHFHQPAKFYLPIDQKNQCRYQLAHLIHTTSRHTHGILSNAHARPHTCTHDLYISPQDFLCRSIQNISAHHNWHASCTQQAHARIAFGQMLSQRHVPALMPLIHSLYPRCSPVPSPGYSVNHQPPARSL